jgi:hypothetical protein
MCSSYGDGGYGQNIATFGENGNIKTLSPSHMAANAITMLILFSLLVLGILSATKVQTNILIGNIDGECGSNIGLPLGQPTITSPI